jgi:hypothetical protein
MSMTGAGGDGVLEAGIPRRTSREDRTETHPGEAQDRLHAATSGWRILLDDIPDATPDSTTHPRQDRGSTGKGIG